LSLQIALAVGSPAALIEQRACGRRRPPKRLGLRDRERNQTVAETNGWPGRAAGKGRFGVPDASRVLQFGLAGIDETPPTVL
jgi:hypothetical protein